MAGSERIVQSPDRGLVATLAATLGRLGVSLAVPIVAFIVLWQGFLFLRDSDASKPIIVIVAIVWGVGGVGALYWITNWLIEKLPGAWRSRIIPFLFVGPALAILTWYLLLPTLRSLYLSFFAGTSTTFIGLDNYVFALTDSVFQVAIRNNVLWLVLGTSLSTGFGLLMAVLIDRIRFQAVAKTLIFLPLVISFVGAGVIWRFVYAFKPAGQEQIGLLNAFVTSLGLEPQGWVTIEPWNTIFLIVILVWAQTGFAMVILSAALKGVPDELLEAARIDGASERQVFTGVVIPTIKGSIVTVATTIAILSLKIFDIVKAMTGGQFDTNVIATLQFDQMFRFQDYGRGSALAIILLLAVTPVIWYNLRQFRQRGTFK